MSHVSHVPYFLETLKRKLYRKKIPENAIIVTQVTRDGRTWTLWTPFPVIPESLTRKMYREKIPEIVKMVSMEPGTVPLILPKRFVTCQVRCLVYRSIVKRHAMTGSRLGRYAESRPAPGFRRGGARAFRYRSIPATLPQSSEYLHHPSAVSSGESQCCSASPAVPAGKNSR